MTPFDLVVVGAGPAGLRAAVEAAAGGVSVTLVDENREPGGQIYRGSESGAFAGTSKLGPDYAAGAVLTAAFRASGVQALFGATVIQIEREADGSFCISVATGHDTAAVVRARTVIAATGAQERPFPIDGWTLPGVMTAGAAQTMLKADGVVPDGPVVLAGTGPLLYLLAAQYAALGVAIDTLLDTAAPGNWRRALPHVAGFLSSRYAFKGLGLLYKALAATRIIRGVEAVSAIGDTRLSAVTYRKGATERTIPTHVLLLHHGVVPQINLTWSAGAQHRWNAARLAFEPVRDASGQTDVPGLFIAGDSGGIGGAQAAEAEGALAAFGALCMLRGTAGGDDRQERQWRRRLAVSLRGRAFLDALYAPRQSHLSPPDGVIVCRCEEVTAGDIRKAVRRGAMGPNQVKAFTRAGMGPCQSRMCGLTTVAIIAEATGQSPGDIGHMRLRAPVKPVTVAQIASLSEADERRPTESPSATRPCK